MINGCERLLAALGVLSLLWMPATSVAQSPSSLADFAEYEAFELYDAGLKRLYGLEGEVEDRVMGTALLKKAAADGFGPAYNLLGSLLLESRGWFSSPKKANRMFEKGAELGDPQSIFNLAYSYRIGRGVKRDLVKARDLFLEVVEPEKPYLMSPENFSMQRATEAASYLNLGGLYSRENSIEFDIERAHAYWKKGDELGSAMAAMILAIDFASGEDVERDDEKAEYYLDRYDLLAQNSMRSSLGGAYFVGMDREVETYFEEMRGAFVDDMQKRITAMQVSFGIALLRDEESPDPARAARWLELALKGDSNAARLRLARLYYRGEGVAEDKARARELLDAIGRDSNLGDYNLGLMMVKGEGGPPDRETGERLIRGAAEGNLFVASMYLENGGEGKYYSYEEALETCQQEAEKGNVAAKHSLGVRHLKGGGVEWNEKLAKELIKFAAENGYAAAQYIFGTRFSGMLEPFSYGFTKKWVELSAEQGYLPAMHYRAGMVQNGFVYSRDLRRAAEMYEACVDRGYAESMTSLGRLYWLGFGVAVDLEKAVELYKQASDKDEPVATMYLGMAYTEGKGVTADKGKAYELLLRACDLGSVGAHHMLGDLYAEGGLGEPDWEEAVYWYEKGAGYGYVNSMVALGKLYRDGTGVAASRLLALNWFSRALARYYYNDDIQYEVAKLLSDGDWSEGNPKQAIELFRTLEIGGYAPVKYHLAMMNYEGVGMEQSDKKAIVKFRKMASLGAVDLAKEFGDDYRSIMKSKPKAAASLFEEDELTVETHRLAAASAYMLGELTREGRGVKKDERVARLWFQVAAKAGNRDAQYELGRTMWSESGGTPALEWLSQAADGGQIEAQFFLGERFFEGELETLEEKRVVGWLKQAAGAAHTGAIELLNKMNIRWEKLDTNEGDGESEEEIDLRGVLLG